MLHRWYRPAIHTPRVRRELEGGGGGDLPWLPDAQPGAAYNQPAYNQPAYNQPGPAYGAPDPALRDAKNKAAELVAAKCKELAAEMNQFITMQAKLTEGENEIADQFVRMDSHAKQVEAALQWTRKATRDAEAAVEAAKQQQALQQQQGDMGAVDVDSIVVPVNGLSEQLLECVAASQAIEGEEAAGRKPTAVLTGAGATDAIYVLGKALVSDDVKLDCETYTKEMRKLCSQQFIHLATIRKVRGQRGRALSSHRARQCHEALRMR